MLNKIQIKTMLELQNRMNSKVNPQWLTAKYAFLRAAMVEIGEAIMSTDYKWWKAGTIDTNNIQVEIIDFIHFALSATIIEYNGDFEQAADTISLELAEDVNNIVFDGKKFDIAKLDYLTALDLMIGLAAANRVSWPLVIKSAQIYQMDGESIYKTYVGKNILNIFRQDFGYKEGTYIKEWHGKEDNVYLHHALMHSDINSATFSEDVYNFLKGHYPKEQYNEITPELREIGNKTLKDFKESILKNKDNVVFCNGRTLDEYLNMALKSCNPQSKDIQKDIYNFLKIHFQE